MADLTIPGPELGNPVEVVARRWHHGRRQILARYEHRPLGGGPVVRVSFEWLPAHIERLRCLPPAPSSPESNLIQWLTPPGGPDA